MDNRCTQWLHSIDCIEKIYLQTNDGIFILSTFIVERVEMLYNVYTVNSM